MTVTQDKLLKHLKHSGDGRNFVHVFRSAANESMQFGVPFQFKGSIEMEANGLSVEDRHAEMLAAIRLKWSKIWERLGELE